MKLMQPGPPFTSYFPDTYMYIYTYTHNMHMHTCTHMHTHTHTHTHKYKKYSYTASYITSSVAFMQSLEYSLSLICSLIIFHDLYTLPNKVRVLSFCLGKVQSCNYHQEGDKSIVMLQKDCLIPNRPLRETN